MDCVGADCNFEWLQWGTPVRFKSGLDCGAANGFLSAKILDFLCEESLLKLFCTLLRVL